MFVTMPNTPETLDIQSVDGADGTRILKLTGQLTMRTLFDFQTAARNETSKAMILDVANVAYMDSAGLGSVIGVFTSCQRNNRGFAIIGVSDRISVLFEVTNVDGILPVFDSLEAAESSLAAGRA